MEAFEIVMAIINTLAVIAFQQYLLWWLITYKIVRKTQGQTQCFQDTNDVENGEKELKDLKQFLANVRKYTDPEELTAEMLNDLVDKILVHAPDKSSGHRKQKIEIYYNAVGIIKYRSSRFSLSHIGKIG